MDQPRPFDQQRRVNRRSRMSGACAFAPTRQQQLGPVLFPPTIALGVEFPKLARLWVDGPRTPGQQRDFLMEDPSPKSLEETPLPNPKPPLLASPLPTLAPATWINRFSFPGGIPALGCQVVGKFGRRSLSPGESLGWLSSFMGMPELWRASKLTATSAC